jgi:hypothetical protein
VADCSRVDGIANTAEAPVPPNVRRVVAPANAVRVTEVVERVEPLMAVLPDTVRLVDIVFVPV